MKILNHTTPSGVYIMGIDESKRCSDGYFYYVYCVVNLINNRLYIGKRSSKNLYESYLGSGTAIKEAVKKYGKENFGRHILEYTTSPEDLHKLEMYYIDVVFGAVRTEFCYNLVLDSGRPMNGRAVSDSTKQKLREINLGKKVSLSARLKIGLAHRGRKDSLETRLKKSISSKGKIIHQKQRDLARLISKSKYDDPIYMSEWIIKNRVNCKKVYQYTMSGEFLQEYPNTKVAGESVNTCLYTFFRRGFIHSKGFIWSYFKHDNILDHFIYDKYQKKYVKLNNE